MTNVPFDAASQSQSTADSGFVGSSWPVTIVSDEESSRWVTGMPALAGAASAEETPGTTSTGIPAATSDATSSPPRPKT